MFSYIPITYLNDFVFCPRSIYYKTLYQNYDKSMYEDIPQVEGTAAHASIDTSTYSTRKDVLQGLDVYSNKYNLCGRIDTYDANTKELRERKKNIKHIYDGYIFQIYAQYFCMTEMGFEVNTLSLYSIDDNKKYIVLLPHDDQKKYQSFCRLIEAIQKYQIAETPFIPNPAKCARCIYRELCDSAGC